MNKLTPVEAAKARESLNLSQSGVAKATGLSRSYLSQFEGGKRVIEDRWLEALYNHYTELGWKSDTTTDANDDSDTPTFSPGCGVKILDGFVVSEGAAEEHDVEELLEEYYKNSEAIEGCRNEKLDTGFMGLGFDKHEAEGQSLQMLVLMARQYQIKQMLHGQFKDHHAHVTQDNDDSLKTVGDHVEYLITKALPDRVAHAPEEEAA